MEEIQDHCYLPEKWLTNKEHAKVERVIVCEVAKVPRATSKQWKAFLTLANVNAHEPYHQENTEQPWCAWQSCKKKYIVLQKKIAC